MPIDIQIFTGIRFSQYIKAAAMIFLSQLQITHCFVKTDSSLYFKNKVLISILIKRYLTENKRNLITQKIQFRGFG